MISFTVRMNFSPEDRAAVAGYLRNLTLASRQEPGCVSYIPHTLTSDPDTVVIYEQYQDEAALEAHRATSHFEQWATHGLYPKMLERSLETLEALL